MGIDTEPSACGAAARVQHREVLHRCSSAPALAARPAAVLRLLGLSKPPLPAGLQASGSGGTTVLAATSCPALDVCPKDSLEAPSPAASQDVLAADQELQDACRSADQRSCEFRAILQTGAARNLGRCVSDLLPGQCAISPARRGKPWLQLQHPESAPIHPRSDGTPACLSGLEAPPLASTAPHCASSAASYPTGGREAVTAAPLNSLAGSAGPDAIMTDYCSPGPCGGCEAVASDVAVTAAVCDGSCGGRSRSGSVEPMVSVEDAEPAQALDGLPSTPPPNPTSISAPRSAPRPGTAAGSVTPLDPPRLAEMVLSAPWVPRGAVPGEMTAAETPGSGACPISEGRSAKQPRFTDPAGSAEGKMARSGAPPGCGPGPPPAAVPTNSTWPPGLGASAAADVPNHPHQQQLQGQIGPHKLHREPPQQQQQQQQYHHHLWAARPRRSSVSDCEWDSDSDSSGRDGDLGGLTGTCSAAAAAATATSRTHSRSVPASPVRMRDAAAVPMTVQLMMAESLSLGLSLGPGEPVVAAGMVLGAAMGTGAVAGAGLGLGLGFLGRGRLTRQRSVGLTRKRVLV